MTNHTTTFLVTKETEAQRLLDIAVCVTNRFWQIKDFYLIPHDIPDFSGREICFPDFKYPKSFWDEAKKLAKNVDTLDMPLGADPKVIAETAKLVDPPPPINKLAKKWGRVETSFWDFCFTTFPDYFDKIKSLEVWVTKYNYLGSFNLATDTIRIWSHFETTPAEMAYCILSSVFRQKHLGAEYSWEESEAAIDHLLLYSKLNKLFPDWKPILKTFRGKSKYGVESAAYFKKLGFDSSAPIAIIDGKLTAQNAVLNNVLTQTEYEILTHLTAQNGSIVNFETLGDIIWKNEACEKYSEWAIAQTIHRLRSKIQSLGLTPEIIQTKRGQGYYLLS